jgi:hypothetical protein
MLSSSISEVRWAGTCRVNASTCMATERYYVCKCSDRTYPPSLFEAQERFRNACKLMDIHTAGCADSTFFLWYAFVSTSKWRKAVVKAIDRAKCEYVIVTAIKARQTYGVEPADQPIPEPKWTSLPVFDQMLMDAFDSSICGSNAYQPIGCDGTIQTCMRKVGTNTRDRERSTLSVLFRAFFDLRAYALQAKLVQLSIP